MPHMYMLQFMTSPVQSSVHESACFNNFPLNLLCSFINTEYALITLT